MLTTGGLSLVAGRLNRQGPDAGLRLSSVQRLAAFRDHEAAQAPAESLLDRLRLVAQQAE